MEIKKVFIGNLDFNVTGDEVKSLLSEYGTVVNIKMHQAKGYAFVEMSSAAEAETVVRKLDGKKYREREMRISLEMKAGKARALSVKRYKERGENRSGGKPAVSGNSKSVRSGGERAAMPRPERERRTAGKPEESAGAERTERYGSKSPRMRVNSRYNEKPDYNRGEKPESGRRSGERPKAPGNRPLRDYSGERNRGDGKTAERNGNNIRERPKNKSEYPERTFQERSPREGKRADFARPVKPDHDFRPGGKKPRTSSKISDSWREKPEMKEFQEERPGDYSKPRSLSGSQNRFSRSSGAKTGDGNRKRSSGAQGPKSRNTAGVKNTGARRKRD